MSVSNPQNQPQSDIRSILDDNTTHYERVCLNCGNTWLGLHCPHDGYQNPCPACDTKPAQVLLNPIKSDLCGCNGVTDLDEAAQAIEQLITNHTNAADNSEEHNAQNARLKRALGERTYTKAEMDAAVIAELERYWKDYRENPGHNWHYIEDRIAELKNKIKG